MRDLQRFSAICASFSMDEYDKIELRQVHEKNTLSFSAFQKNNRSFNKTTWCTLLKCM